MPFLPPNQQRQSTEELLQNVYYGMFDKSTKTRYELTIRIKELLSCTKWECHFCRVAGNTVRSQMARELQQRRGISVHLYRHLYAPYHRMCITASVSIHYCRQWHRRANEPARKIPRNASCCRRNKDDVVEWLSFSWEHCFKFLPVLSFSKLLAV